MTQVEVVRATIQVIGKRLAADSRQSSVVADIIARIDAVNQSVKGLLLFARPPQPHPIAVDISTLLAMTGSLLNQGAAYREV